MINRNIILTLLEILFFSLVACGTVYVNFGYPHKIQIEKEGGEIILYGTKEVLSFSIKIEGKTYSKSPNDQDPLIAEWLTINKVQGECKLILKADPNYSQRTREAELYLYSGPEFDSIRIIQR